MYFHLIILAGGYGTRIASALNGLPKGLIPTEDTTLLGRQLKELQSLRQLDQITIVTSQKFYNQYNTWIQKYQSKFPITLLNDKTTSNQDRLGALGDLVFALDKTNGWNTDTLVLSSDTYYSFSLDSFLNFYSLHPNFVTVVRHLDKNKIKGRHGCAVIQQDQIIDFIEKPEKPPSSYACVAFYLYPVHILALLKQYQKEGNNMDTPGSIIPWLIQHNHPVHAMVIDSPIVDVGTPPDIDAIKKLAL